MLPHSMFARSRCCCTGMLPCTFARASCSCTGMLPQSTFAWQAAVEQPCCHIAHPHGQAADAQAYCHTAHLHGQAAGAWASCRCMGKLQMHRHASGLHAHMGKPSHSGTGTLHIYGTFTVASCGYCHRPCMLTASMVAVNMHLLGVHAIRWASPVHASHAADSCKVSDTVHHYPPPPSTAPLQLGIVPDPSTLPMLPCNLLNGHRSSKPQFSGRHSCKYHPGWRGHSIC